MGIDLAEWQRVGVLRSGSDSFRHGKWYDSGERARSTGAANTLGQSIVRLTVQSDGSLEETDFFAPQDAASLNPTDLDLGSGGVSALPDQMGTASHPHLLVQGKRERCICSIVTILGVRDRVPAAQTRP